MNSSPSPKTILFTGIDDESSWMTGCCRSRSQNKRADNTFRHSVRSVLSRHIPLVLSSAGRRDRVCHRRRIGQSHVDSTGIGMPSTARSTGNTLCRGLDEIKTLNAPLCLITETAMTQLYTSNAAGGVDRDMEGVVGYCMMFAYLVLWSYVV